MARKTSSSKKLEQIAAQAGVSRITVWRVMKNDPNVASETRNKILRLFDQFRFVPPVKLIGLIVHDIANPFWSRLGFEVETAIEKAGMQMVLTRSGGSLEKELAAVNRLRGIKTSGIIYAPLGNSAETLAPIIADGNVAVALLEGRQQTPNVDSFSVDGRRATHEALRYLAFAHRHRRIGYIRGSRGITGDERYYAFLEMAAKLPTVQVDSSWIHSGDFGLNSGREFGRKLVRMENEGCELPTAVIAANDLMAIGLIQSLHEAKWDLPTKLSVIGFDNIAWSDFVHPPLTTMNQPLDLLAKEVIKRLRKRMEEIEKGVPPEDRLPAESFVFDASLTERGSVRPLA